MNVQLLVYMSATYLQDTAHWVEERMSDPLELELETGVS